MDKEKEERTRRKIYADGTELNCTLKKTTPKMKKRRRIRIEKNQKKYKEVVVETEIAGGQPEKTLMGGRSRKGGKRIRRKLRRWKK